MFVAAFMLGVGLTQHIAGARWAAARPTGLVVRDLDRNMTRGAAWKELQRRLEAGELSQAMIDDALDRIVIRIDAGAPDVPESGHFLGALFAKDRLRSDQWRRIAEAVARPSPRIEARTRARAGRPFQFAIAAPPMYPFQLQRMVRVRTVRAEDGTKLRLDRWTPGDRSTNGLGRQTVEAEAGVDLLPLGPQTLTFDLEVAVVLNQAVARMGWSDDMAALHRWTVQIPWAVEVVPPDTPTIEVVRDPALADEIRSRISVIGFQIDPSHRGSFDEVELHLEVRPYEDFGLAFDVIVRADGRQSVIGRTLRQPYSSTIEGLRMTVDDAGGLIEAGRADVILVTNLAYADDSESLRKWDGELTFENVPVLNPEVLETADALVAE